MKYLFILLLFSFPLVADEKIKLVCEGILFPTHDGIELPPYKKSIVLNVDDEGISVDGIRIENKSRSGSGGFESWSDYTKDEDKIYYSDTKLKRGEPFIIHTGNINRINGEFTQKANYHMIKNLQVFKGKCKKAERAF